MNASETARTLKGSMHPRAAALAIIAQAKQGLFTDEAVERDDRASVQPPPLAPALPARPLIPDKARDSEAAAVPRSRPEDVARARAAQFKADLHATAYLIYLVLLTVALKVAQARGYVAGTTQVTFFAPSESVAWAIGIGRTTLWRHLRQLEGLGLIEHRPLKGDFMGLTRNFGTLWAVKTGNFEGQAAKLSYDDFKHPHRDLEADRQRGHTAYNEVKQSRSLKTYHVLLRLLPLGRYPLTNWKPRYP